ncbi:MAG TPA: bifunctional YncE family protein/alkaline phosphatase family protein [Gemmatimonadales bacterium]
MPLGMVVSPAGSRVVLLLGGWREHGLQVVDRTGQVRQTIPQAAAFVGLAFSGLGTTLYASGGNTDVVYRYRWVDDQAQLSDSIILAPRDTGKDGTHYPAGLALSPDGGTLYAAENLADSLAVVDVSTGAVIQRLATGRYPYGVVVTPDGSVWVSNWGASTLSLFAPAGNGPLTAATLVPAGRHPSALLLNRTGTRVFVASGSTDRITVIDTRSHAIVATLLDPPPSGPDEGTTPNGLALSDDGTRLFVAEADANAVAVFDLRAATADVAAAIGDDRLAGRIPVGWYPTALVQWHDTLLVANGKGAGTGPNPGGPQPGQAQVRRGTVDPDTSYTLGQIRGSVSIVPVTPGGLDLVSLTARVVRANGWDSTHAGSAYPPFQHVIYILKENRTYDQVLGDLPAADGDTSLVLFGRSVTPNHHALAERFGTFDRFFVNAEVSADGHNWSMAGYATDYTQKTTPANYDHGGRTYDYEGENRGRIPEEDVAEPAQGYIWDLARRAGITFANFGEFSVEETDAEGDKRYHATKPFLAAHTDPRYPSFDMAITDQTRIDVWLDAFHRWVAQGTMPALQILHLPCDHTAGALPGMRTPRAMVADNDLALGRLVDALSRSPFWKNTVVFVMEDDAQNGPDHVDSHRSPLLVISAYSKSGVFHRFTNTTDALRTMEGILKLDALSQYDHYGHPLREIWRDTPDTAPFAALTPAVPLAEQNPAGTRAARESRKLDFSVVDAADMDSFNRVLWMAVKGEQAPYPGTHRMSAIEARRSR